MVPTTPENSRKSKRSVAMDAAAGRSDDKSWTRDDAVMSSIGAKDSSDYAIPSVAAAKGKSTEEEGFVTPKKMKVTKVTELAFKLPPPLDLDATEASKINSVGAQSQPSQQVGKGSDRRTLSALGNSNEHQNHSRGIRANGVAQPSRKTHHTGKDISYPMELSAGKDNAINTGTPVPMVNAPSTDTTDNASRAKEGRKRKRQKDRSKASRNDATNGPIARKKKKEPEGTELFLEGKLKLPPGFYRTEKSQVAVAEPPSQVATNNANLQVESHSTSMIDKLHGVATMGAIAQPPQSSKGHFAYGNNNAANTIESDSMQPLASVATCTIKPVGEDTTVRPTNATSSHAALTMDVAPDSEAEQDLLATVNNDMDEDLVVTADTSNDARGGLSTSSSVAVLQQSYGVSTEGENFAQSRVVPPQTSTGGLTKCIMESGNSTNAPPLPSFAPHLSVAPVPNHGTTTTTMKMNHPLTNPSLGSVNSNVTYVATTAQAVVDNVVAPIDDVATDDDGFVFLDASDGSDIGDGTPRLAANHTPEGKSTGRWRQIGLLLACVVGLVGTFYVCQAKGISLHSVLVEMKGEVMHALQSLSRSNSPFPVGHDGPAAIDAMGFNGGVEIDVESSPTDRATTTSPSGSPSPAGSGGPETSSSGEAASTSSGTVPLSGTAEDPKTPPCAGAGSSSSQPSLSGATEGLDTYSSAGSGLSSSRATLSGTAEDPKTSPSAAPTPSDIATPSSAPAGGHTAGHAETLPSDPNPPPRDKLETTIASEQSDRSTATNRDTAVNKGHDSCAKVDDGMIVDDDSAHPVTSVQGGTSTVGITTLGIDSENDFAMIGSKESRAQENSGLTEDQQRELRGMITLLEIWTREEVCKLAQNPFVVRQQLGTSDIGNSPVLYRFDVVFGQICRDTGAEYKALIWRAFHSTPIVRVRNGDDMFKDDLIGLASTVHISC